MSKIKTGRTAKALYSTRDIKYYLHNTISILSFQELFHSQRKSSVIICLKHENQNINVTYLYIACIFYLCRSFRLLSTLVSRLYPKASSSIAGKAIALSGTLDRPPLLRSSFFGHDDNCVACQIISNFIRMCAYIKIKLNIS